MQITVIGVILLPLSLLWAFNPVRLLQLAMISAIFEAAAAVVFGGSFGLQPAMVPGLLFIAYITMQYALGMRYPGEGTVFRTLLPLLALLVYAVLSAKIMPDAFAGRVIVWPQKQDVIAPGPAPLEFTFGNVTQSLYLTIDVLLTLAVALFLTRSAVPYGRIIGAYLTGGYVVVFLVLWQLANKVAGIPFPDDLLHSNPGWVIVDQAVGSVPRMQGSFSEPSALAFHLSGTALCCLWLSIRGYHILRPNLLLALSIVGVLLSTSTTGIVTLAVGLPLVLAMASVGGDHRALRRIGRTVGILLFGGLVAFGPIFLLNPELVDSVNIVVEATLTKGESGSYDDRANMDAAALDTVGETYGLGVGWGSDRSSSFIPGLLANAGLFGLAMVLWLAKRIYCLSKEVRAASNNHSGQILVDGFSAALCGQFTAALLSAPMIVSLIFYIQLGCVVGALARMSEDERPYKWLQRFAPMRTGNHSRPGRELDDAGVLDFSRYKLVSVHLPRTPLRRKLMGTMASVSNRADLVFDRALMLIVLPVVPRVSTFTATTWYPYAESSNGTELFGALHSDPCGFGLNCRCKAILRKP